MISPKASSKTFSLSGHHSGHHSGPRSLNQKTPLNTRALALEILEKIILQNQNWDRSLLPSQLSSQEKSFLQALCLGTLRYYLPLKFILKNLTEKPLRNKDKDIEILMLLALYELLFLHTPAYATLNEIQRATPKKKAWAKGFINGVLRKFIPQQEYFSHEIKKNSLLPDWILKLIQTHYPSFQEAIEAAHWDFPPMHCRVNLQKNSREEYLKKFPDLGVETPEFFPQGLTLKTPMPVNELPGFLQGLISIQDFAPQKTPGLLELKPGLNILDACAAPGGKSAHILESCPEVDLLSIDIDPKRLEKIQENFSRLKLKPSGLLAADATKIFQHSSPDVVSPLAGETDRRATSPLGREGEIAGISTSQFDRILIDAPCSGLGVIRRHPEIALHRKPEDFKGLAERQLQLLNSLWPTLRSQGILLYATCSIAPQENDEVIAEFLASHPDAEIIPLDLSHPDHLGIKTTYGWQFLPTQQGPDGFYYAKLGKN